MTLIVVDPVERYVATDTRVSQGDTYSDGHSKAVWVGDVLLAYAGCRRPLELARQYIWSEWIQGAKPREIWMLAEDLAQRFVGDMDGVVIVASHGRAHSIESDYQVFSIDKITGYGNGAEAAGPLLLERRRPEDVFRLVSGCVWAVSPTYNRYDF